MSTNTHEWDSSDNEYDQPAPDPNITYDHMESETNVKAKPTTVIPVWSFIIEEITIIGLLTALYFSV